MSGAMPPLPRTSSLPSQEQLYFRLFYPTHKENLTSPVTLPLELLFYHYFLLPSPFLLSLRIARF